MLRCGWKQNRTAVQSILDKVLQDLLLQVLLCSSCRAAVHPLPFAKPDQMVVSPCKKFSRLSPKMITGEVCLAAPWSIWSMLWSGAAKLNSDMLMQDYLVSKAGAIHPCNVHPWLIKYINLYQVCVGTSQWILAVVAKSWIASERKLQLSKICP